MKTDEETIEGIRKVMLEGKDYGFLEGYAKALQEVKTKIEDISGDWKICNDCEEVLEWDVIHDSDHDVEDIKVISFEKWNELWEELQKLKSKETDEDLELCKHWRKFASKSLKEADEK